MLLRPGGIDVFYIDESHDRNQYVVTAVAVPFLRQVEANWQIIWPDQLAAAKAWRRRIADELKIPTRKELHATKLVGGRGNYLFGKRQIARANAAEVYGGILSRVNFLPEGSVITVAGTPGPQMYGRDRLERVMYALFQRMRRQCVARDVNAMVFFDEGHPEYRTLYRQAMVHLMTGSRYGADRNLPLDMFVKDGNEKRSEHCLFTQLADLISYAALAKRRSETGELDEDHRHWGFHNIYDTLPNGVKNLLAGGADGIVRIG
jgi:hypothetical protein